MAALGGSGLRQPELYYAVFEAAGRRAAQMPRTVIPAGTRVLRSISREYKGVSNDADSARTILGGSRKTNLRWSGAQPGGHLEPGQGALYVSLETEALLDEALHYSRPRQHTTKKLARGRKEVTPSPPRTVREVQHQHVFFVFDLRQPLAAVDFTDNSLRSYLSSLDGEPAVAARLREASLPSLWTVMQLLREDYSVPRALGNAAFLRARAEALIVPTVRDDFSAGLGVTTRSRNAVIAGVDDVPLNVLHPVGRLVVENVNGQHLSALTPL